MCTEAVGTQSRELVLGNSLSEFMRKTVAATTVKKLSENSPTKRDKLLALRAKADAPKPCNCNERKELGENRGRHQPASEATLTLNLFEDVVLTGIVERTAPTFSGGYSISGRLVGDPPGTLTVVVNGETVAGSVRTLGGTYRIRSVGSGLYAISEIEEPPLNCGVEEPHSETDHQH